MQRDIVRRGKLSFFGSVSGKATAGERQHREIWISIARARFGRRGSAKGMEATRGRAHGSAPTAIRLCQILCRVRLLARAAGAALSQHGVQPARLLAVLVVWGTGARAALI